MSDFATVSSGRVSSPYVPKAIVHPQPDGSSGVGPTDIPDPEDSNPEDPTPTFPEALLEALVACYKMETSSPRVSSVAGAPNLALVGSPDIAVTAGKIGNAADGGDGGAIGYLREATQGNFDFNTDFSVAAWIQMNDLFRAEDQFIFGYHQLFGGQSIPDTGTEVGTAWGLYYTANDDSLTFFAMSTNNNYFSAVAVAVNDAVEGFHHVALTYKASTKTISLYVDGVLKQATVLDQPIAESDGNCRFTVFQTFEELFPFFGYVDELYIWNPRVLTADEVAELKQAGEDSLSP